MGKSVKCAACGLYYNGAVYEECPYCRSSAKASTEEKKSGGKRPFPWTKTGKKAVKEDENAEAADKGKTSDKVFEDSGKTISIGITQKKGEIDILQEPEKKTEEQEKPTPAEDTYDALKQAPAENAGLIGNILKKKDSGASGLQQEISRSGRTVGKYISNAAGESIMPVVGWLVSVKGPCYGQSFQLKNGRNKIGRAHEMDVKLLNDNSVSRACVASVIYDSKAAEFSIVAGESDSLCYLNGKALYERTVLTGYEEIEFGDSGLNKYVFVPFCGKNFTWASAAEK
ncbi:MAG: FHA domain-containing protein [Oscillospiraceae bacterium]|nr:FHA domain-containing protein [Oscillospiraceae bacterium]